MADRVELNPYVISKELGGVMVPGAKPRFGGFGLLQTTADMLAAKPEALPEVSFTDSDDRIIVKAFEQIRDGFAVDRFLADPSLARRLTNLCRKLGVRQPPAAINRRLLRLRKASGGSILRPSTKRETHHGLIDRLGPAVEVAMVKLAARHGASVDDILADPDLGLTFEAVAAAIVPGGSPLEYRLCALQIRKSRHLDRRDRSLFDKLDSADIVDRFRRLGPMSALHVERLPESEGLIRLTEPTRPLLVARFRDLHAAGRLFESRAFLSGLAAGSQFWQPDPSELKLDYLGVDQLPTGSAKLWELRLIRDLHPTFNWPVRAA